MISVKNVEKIKSGIADLFFTLFFSWRKVKTNKIVFSNFHWLGFGCNPKYIAKEIIKQKLPYELVWLSRPDSIEKDEFPEGIRIADYDNVKERFYELSTAKVWIDNVQKTNDIKNGLKKKKNQIYINTWHGSLGIKKIGSSVSANANMQNWISLRKQESENIDYMISNSTFETDIYRNALWFNKEICKFGHPRNDILINNSKGINDKVRAKLNIPKEDKIALYVPSYRDDDKIETYNIDYEKLKNELEKKFGSNWTIITKFHPNCYEIFDILIPKDKNVVDASKYPDVQELLNASDIAISDYSSCIFDFMLTRKPGFIYANDYKKYNTARGLYFPLEDTPFPVAENMEQFIENIRQFDYNKYQKSVENFLISREVLEDGKASERVVELIKNIIGENK